MKRRPLRARRFVRTASIVGIVAAVALALVPAASESSTQNRLFAFVVPSNREPLPACSGPDCTPANSVWHFIYVANANRLTNLNLGTTRATVPNAFAVGSVDSSIFVDGVATFSSTLTPPPDAGEFSFWAGHWPSTVSCGGLPPPCGVVGSPAVLPGENTAVLYTGWTHANTEPNGTYVFKFTVHGTLNGAPVDLHATSPPIVMTP
jgi:hypothetical protein